MKAWLEHPLTARLLSVMCSEQPLRASQVAALPTAAHHLAEAVAAYVGPSVGIEAPPDLPAPADPSPEAPPEPRRTAGNRAGIDWDNEPRLGVWSHRRLAEALGVRTGTVYNAWKVRSRRAAAQQQDAAAPASAPEPAPVAEPPEVSEAAPSGAPQRPGQGRRLSHTIAGRLSRAEIQAGKASLLDADYWTRPKTRGDCIGGPRPCPWVGCRYHLAVDVTAAGGVTLRFGHSDVERLAETCCLDVADRGSHTLRDVAAVMGMTHQGASQIEAAALAALQAHAAMGGAA